MLYFICIFLLLLLTWRIELMMMMMMMMMISGHPSAAGRAQDCESSPVKEDWPDA